MTFRGDRRLSSWLIVLAVILAGYATLASGTGDTIDRLLAPMRFAAFQRQASGKVAIVEMDAASAAAIRRWPWSRTNYAEVVDRLRRAGAASIVFDVEFSSASDPAGDQAFARALARADGLVALPTFGQRAGTADQRTIDALPIAPLRAHAALASVSIAPDDDGQVRDMPFATVTDDMPRPSLSAFIAARSGAADATYPIDMSIDPGSIPRLSFVAVRDGRFDPARVRGRNILIGATAVEMGDRYGTPQWGVIPGVVVQALATETLLRGVPAAGAPLTLMLFAALVAIALVLARSTARIVMIAAAALAGLVALALVAQHVLLVTYPIATALIMLILATAACLTRDVLARFARQRTIDEATGLPNVRALLAASTAAEETVVAVAQINNHDTLHAVLGSAAAATLVGRVAERLALVADAHGIYRIADRRLAFRLDVDAPVDELLDGLRVTMLQPIEVGGRRVDIAMTVGLAAGSAKGLDALLTQATMAADQAVRADAFWCHAANDLVALERSLSLMGDLDHAISAGGIEVHYQPKYHLRDRRVTSAEALVRWRHPSGRLIGPDQFIPAAERTNRIGPLTLHVLQHVLRDVLAWHQAGHDITAAVNVSAKLLANAAFNAEVEQLIAATGVPTSSLLFEVTESAAMSDPAAAIAALRHYRELGIAVSMDDYGTGQSTLTYLRQLPLNELKIDRSFVQHAHRNRNDALLVRSTIDLAHGLGLKVVAEGVEEQDCLTFLESCGCDLVQGYLISRPVPLDALMALLDRDHAAAA